MSISTPTGAQADVFVPAPIGPGPRYFGALYCAGTADPPPANHLLSAVRGVALPWGSSGVEPATPATPTGVFAQLNRTTRAYEFLKPGGSAGNKSSWSMAGAEAGQAAPLPMNKVVVWYRYINSSTGMTTSTTQTANVAGNLVS